MALSEIFFQSADDASQIGAGTASDPIRVLAQPGDFDNWMQIVMRRTSIKKVTLLPGVYWTRGAWAYPPPHYSMITRPITLEGAEDSPSIIRLSPDAIYETDGKPRPDTQTVHTGRMGGDLPGIRIRNLTIDGNEAALPPGKLVTKGLQIWGSDALVENIIVRNLRGSRELKHEAFGVNVRALRDQTQPGPNGGSTLRRITVFNDGDRSDYFSGVYPAYIDVGKGTKMTTVENCHAISSGKRPSRLAFSFGSRVAYRACTATGFSYGPYVDNSPATDVTFRDCVWDRHAHCAIHISSNGPVREKVNISNCTFNFEPHEGIAMIGIEIIDHPNFPQSIVRDITVRECTFKVVGRSKLPFVIYSLAAKNISNCRMVLCTFPDGSQRNVIGAAPKIASGDVDPRALELVSCRTTSGREIGRLPQLR